RTPVHVALILFILAVFTFGVAFSSQASGLGSANVRLAGLLEQLAFFIVCMALVRVIGNIDVALRALAAAAVIAAAIAVIEHITLGSWGHWLFEHATQNRFTNASHQLALRGDTRRVKAGSDFALEFGWVMVVLLPAVVVTSLRHKWSQVTYPVGVALVTLAVYWSYSRSALAGLVIVLVALALAAREPRATYAIGVTLISFVAVWAIHPIVASHFSESVASGSVNVRFQRLGPVLQAVAPHPFRGLGLGLLDQSGFPTTDNAFLLNYVEIGAVGVVALGVLLLVTLTQAMRGLAIADDDARLVVAASVAAILAYIGSTIFYDAFTLEQGLNVMWVFVAIATLLIEQHTGVLRLPAPGRMLFGITAVAGVGLGVAAYFVAPSFVGNDLVFTTLPAYSDALPFNPTLSGTTLGNTVCTEIEHMTLRDASVTCTIQPATVGTGSLHVEATNLHAYNRTVRLITAEAKANGDASFSVYAEGSPTSGRRAVWATAPMWVPVGLLGLLVLAPWRRRRDGDGNGDADVATSSTGASRLSAFAQPAAAGG
ncbi:MAG: hypothetical protein JO222_00530, partial [Frankiales bacterium]|nr:hypothetical protein [Frankiales bacterium]